jgi:pimeloyl-ACP methyl ester carboxylesterase
VNSTDHPLRRRNHWKKAGLGIVLLAGVGLSVYLIDLRFQHRPVDSPHVDSSRRHLDLSTTTTTATIPQPPYVVQDETVTLFDPRRITPPRGSVAGHSGRQLITIIRRPIGVPGPRPLIVFAHGWNSNPMVYESLLDTWAEAGFIVAAPMFPDSTNTLPGTPVSDYPEQAQDISFVISSLLGGMAGPIDPTRIAVAGHSDGGTDVALMALNPRYSDPRVRAYISLSGEIPDGISGPWGTPVAGALLVAVGTADEYGLLSRSLQVFQTAPMPKALLTLAGGDHLTTFIGDSAAEAAMRTETDRFLDAVFSSPTITSSQLQAALLPTGDAAIALRTGAG